MTKLALFVSLSLAACDGSPLAPFHAEPYYNAPLYAALWAQLTACSGIAGSLSAVHFYTAPHLESATGQEYGGYWFESGNKIVVESEYRDNTLVVAHEMMHAKLQRGDHPAEYFNGRCGDLRNGG